MTILYLVRNLVNGKIYVGKTDRQLSRRFYEHIYKALVERSDNVLHRAIRKYGKEVFEVVELDRVPKDLSSYTERAYIMLYCSNKPRFGYNVTMGGEGWSGGRHSDEWRRRHSVAMSGYLHPLYGTRHSEEARRKMSQAQKDRFSKERPHNYRKDIDTDVVSEMYANGLSAISIAKTFGADKKTILERLHKSGVRIRPAHRPKSNKDAASRITEDVKAQLKG